jgi:hypothetical protein
MTDASGATLAKDASGATRGQYEWYGLAARREAGLPPASSGRRGAGLRPAEASAGQERQDA